MRDVTVAEGSNVHADVGSHDKLLVMSKNSTWDPSISSRESNLRDPDVRS